MGEMLVWALGFVWVGLEEWVGSLWVLGEQPRIGPKVQQPSAADAERVAAPARGLQAWPRSARWGRCAWPRRSC